MCIRDRLYISPEFIDGSSPSNVYLIVTEGSSAVIIRLKGASLNPLSWEKSNLACAATCCVNDRKIKQVSRLINRLLKLVGVFKLKINLRYIVFFRIKRKKLL